MTAPLRTMACDLVIPNRQHLYAQIEANARHAKRLAVQNSRVGQQVVICGAGPSLAAEHTRLPDAEEVWGCNSALPYLYDRGIRVTHGFCIDQGEAMLGAEEWGRALPVRYLVASSVHPLLVRRLLAAERHLTFFHSFLGQPDPEGWKPKKPGESYEWHLYTTRYKPTVQVGHGLNSVQRAVCLALFLGFDRITVVGADCAAAPDGPPMPAIESPEYPAWLASRRLYADGRTAAAFGPTSWMAEGEIDGRRWHTRGDMVISAVHMVQMVQAFPDRIVLQGDTLPNAILPHANDAEWMERMPRLGGAGRVENFEVRTPKEVAA